MSKTIAFIGAGNMGGAIIRATCRVVDSREVAIYDVLPEKADALAAETGCGRLVPMSEHMLDIATPVSGCSPAFVYMFIDALADGGVQIGVPREQARILAAQTVLGSAAMVLESGIHPGELKDNVCSPAGSTIAGVEKLEEHAFRYAVAQSIVAAYERNCQLG